MRYFMITLELNGKLFEECQNFQGDLSQVKRLYIKGVALNW